MSAADGKDPDGVTRNGTAYWYARRRKDDDQRILGPYPAWPKESAPSS